MLWMYAVSGLCLLVCLPLYRFYRKSMHAVLAAAFRCLGTLCAASLALIAAVRLDPRCWICFAALFLHAAGDFLLEFHTFSGTGLYLLGHVCLICFFTVLFPVSSLHLIVVLCFLGIVIFLLWNWRNSIGKKMSLFIVYGAVLAVTCGLAVAGLSARTLCGQLAATGGALFFISHVMLMAGFLYPPSRFSGWMMIILDAAAQLLFGLSCLV